MGRVIGFALAAAAVWGVMGQVQACDKCHKAETCCKPAPVACCQPKKSCWSLPKLSLPKLDLFGCFSAKTDCCPPAACGAGAAGPALSPSAAEPKKESAPLPPPYEDKAPAPKAPAPKAPAPKASA